MKWLVASRKNISASQLLHFYTVAFENASKGGYRSSAPIRAVPCKTFANVC
jgi:hypothetical protein